jgi:hypothetical protein
MSTSKFSSGEQAGLASATATATRASTAPTVDYGPAPAGVPERDLMSKFMAAEHMIMDGFIWHSISCACNSCVRNDYKFMITFNRPDFRPYV